MSLADGTIWWVVVVALGAGIALGAALARRTSARGAAGAGADQGSAPRIGSRAAGAERDSADALGAPAGPDGGRPAGTRRRPTPPPARDVADDARALRAQLLQAVAEELPGGWWALVLTPPPHAGRMTWHVHLVPAVALDLADGRTVPTAPPLPTHDWQVAGGRGVSVADGDPDPAPTLKTAVVRVSGPYLAVTLSWEPTGSGGPVAAGTLAVRVPGGDAASDLRAAPGDARAVQVALRHALALAFGTRATGDAPVLAYSVASWRQHERTWLTAPR